MVLLPTCGKLYLTHTGIVSFYLVCDTKPEADFDGSKVEDTQRGQWEGEFHQRTNRRKRTERLEVNTKSFSLCVSNEMIAQSWFKVDINNNLS